MILSPLKDGALMVLRGGKGAYIIIRTVGISVEGVSPDLEDIISR